MTLEKNRTEAEKYYTVRGRHYRSGDIINVTIENGHIKEIEEAAYGDALPWIAPGLVDIQVNGYAGKDFNTYPMAENTLPVATRAIWAEGVTSFLPTVTTNMDTAIEGVMRSIAKCLRTDTDLRGTVGGIHLEGPFISPEDGPRGAHPQEFVKAPDWELFRRWQDAAEGLIRIITLSPEWPQAPDFIARCVQAGVRVSIGHTAANTEQICKAVAAGASLSTHLGNGAHTVLPRHPNYIWDQLADDHLWAAIIGDGFHLPDSVVRVIMRVKNSKTILISDCTYLTGLQPGIYKTHIGGTVVLTPDGKLYVADSPKMLAGSAQTIRQGVEHLLRAGLCGLAESWNYASVNPSIYLDNPAKEGLNVGAPADLVLFTLKENRIQIMETIKDGKCIYCKSSSY